MIALFIKQTVSWSILLVLLTIPGWAADGNENTDLIFVNDGRRPADSVYLGATFIRDTAKPLVIWMPASGNSIAGNLYIVIKRPASAGGDTSILLFNSKAAGTTFATGMNLTNVPVVKQYVGYLDTIFFKFVTSHNKTAYSGPNRGPTGAPGEPWSTLDRYYSTVINTTTKTSPAGYSFTIGRRWCAAGWIRDRVINARTDTVWFAFEDMQGNGDFNFTSLTFRMTGAFLMRPPLISEIRLEAYPANDTIAAGDSVRYRATVMVDSVDQNGIHYLIEDPLRSNRVTWAFSGD